MSQNIFYLTRWKFTPNNFNQYYIRNLSYLKMWISLLMKYLLYSEKIDTIYRLSNNWLFWRFTKYKQEITQETTQEITQKETNICQDP